MIAGGAQSVSGFAGTLAFVLPVLRTGWNLSSVQLGFLGSGTYIGFFFGAMLAGLLGDTIGRRAVMMYALLLYCVASAGSAFAGDWPTFFIWRIIAGAGRRPLSPFLFLSHSYSAITEHRRTLKALRDV